MIKKSLEFGGGNFLASTLLVSALSLMPGISMAETSGYWTYSIASDEVTVTGYVGNESRVVIPEIGRAHV